MFSFINCNLTYDRFSFSIYYFILTVHKMLFSALHHQQQPPLHHSRVCGERDRHQTPHHPAHRPGNQRPRAERAPHRVPQPVPTRPGRPRAPLPNPPKPSHRCVIASSFFLIQLFFLNSISKWHVFFFLYDHFFFVWVEIALSI